MNLRSIRVRLTTWYSGILLLGLTLFAAFVWFSMRHELFSGIDAGLQARTQGIEQYLRVEFEEGGGDFAHEIEELAGSLPPGYEMAVIGPDGRAVFNTFHAPDVFRGAPGVLAADQWGHRESSGQHYRTVEHPIILKGLRFRLRLATTSDPAAHTLGQLGLLLFASIPGVVLIAGAGGYFLGRRALAPVDEMTRTARSIGIENLSARLVVPRTGDEVQRLAETWNDMLARLETAVTRISQFTSDASHELRTPIAFIRSTAEIALRRRRTESQYRDSLDHIQTEAERMTQLVGGLLFLARAGAATLADMRPIDLRGPVADACAEIQPLATARNLDFQVETGRDALPVSGDNGALRRMLLALLENAVQYTPCGGTVSVKAGTGAGIVFIEVQDTGVGIPAAALPRVFDRFFRSDPSRSRESGGYGLGLAIALAIAQEHHGRIEVESWLARGSVFRVSLPLNAPAERVGSYVPESGIRDGGAPFAI